MLHSLDCICDVSHVYCDHEILYDGVDTLCFLHVYIATLLTQGF